MVLNLSNAFSPLYDHIIFLLTPSWCGGLRWFSNVEIWSKPRLVMACTCLNMDGFNVLLFLKSSCICVYERCWLIVLFKNLIMSSSTVIIRGPCSWCPLDHRSHPVEARGQLCQLHGALHRLSCAAQSLGKLWLPEGDLGKKRSWEASPTTGVHQGSKPSQGHNICPPRWPRWVPVWD